MLIGRVNSDKEVVVSVQVIGQAQQVALVEAAIDTGYDGFLTLPASLIHDLDLPFAGTARATLGDGKEVGMDLYLGPSPGKGNRARCSFLHRKVESCSEWRCSPGLV